MSYRAATYGSFDEYGSARHSGARPVVSVGSFDGVHLGHQYLLNQLVEWARRVHAPAVVVTFKTHPREVMTGRVMPSLNSPEHKRRLLSKAGVDAILMLDFDEALQQITAEQFMRRHVQQDLAAQGMLVGFNNHIGRNREGTYVLLREIGQKLGVDVRESERVEVSGEAISSSAIRRHVASGDFHWARKMLGRPFSIVGPVVHGDARGRKIGFPTANIELAALAHPPAGVYGVRVKHAEDWRIGAANIGTRPTVDPSRTAPLLEVHVLDFDGDLYGHELEVEFLFHVRREHKFEGIESLKSQLARDIQVIRERVAAEGLEASHTP
ncbi:MAG: riboflavin biosynthesis protein RibF [Planctomycetes bacterium]|nr:riboflavin biosynthesis protein RibF [Planctomycetota bacterium]MCW8135332.1 riboflavin biosynthesis protein RibF [Planctomycetota bacterium]